MIKQTVRSLRKNQTKAEAVLWKYLRNRQFYGKKFVRQYPVQFEYMQQSRFVVVDFYCHEEKLAIEVDGPIHDGIKEFDNYRGALLLQKDVRVIRFTNDEILKNIPCVLKKLNDFFPTPLFQERGRG